MEYWKLENFSKDKNEAWNFRVEETCWISGEKLVDLKFVHLGSLVNFVCDESNSRNSFVVGKDSPPFDSPGASSSFGAASFKSWWARTKGTCRVWSRFQNAVANVMGRLLPKMSQASRWEIARNVTAAMSKMSILDVRLMPNVWNVRINVLWSFWF